MSSYYASARLTTGSEEEDYYFLQPMFEKLPPNEIISQRYAPDVATQVRLIAKDERKNNIHFLPPKVKSAELEAYAQQFNVFDYLGNACTPHINQTVYLKFNNSKHNLMPEAKLKTRVLPAFYVPFQQLYSQQETLFSKNIGLNFPETGQNCVLPTAKDNRGCSFDPIFCSSFESGNLFAAIRKSPFDYDLILQNDVNSCESVAWFNFSVQFLQQGYYSFRIVNITVDMSKLIQRGMKVAYSFLNPIVGKSSKKSGEGWGLCGENIRFGKSGVERQNRKGQFYYELYFEFKCKNKHDIIMFALDVPYSTLESEIFFNKVLFKKIKTMLKVEKNQYGKTISGTPLIAYHITRKKLRGESIQMTPIPSETLLGKDKRKSINLSPINRPVNFEAHNKSIIVLGRMCAADVNGSFIIEGMVDYLMDNVEFESMKRVFDFYFVPLTNVDGVRYGNTLTNLTGSLLNNNWKTPHRHYQAEVFSLKEFLQEVNKDTPISLIINLVSQKQDIYTSVVGATNDHEEVEDSRIFPFILSKRNKLFSFQKSVFFKKNQNSSMCCVLGELFSKALIYQMNVSHFELKRNEENITSSQLLQNEVKQCNAESYRTIGKDILSNYLEHVKLYDKNLLLREKWLKEIEEIQEKMAKQDNIFVEDPRVQDKFSRQFYQIQNLCKIADVKSAKSLISCKILNPPKNFEIDRMTSDLKRKEKVLKSSLPRSVNDFISKRNQTEGYLKAKMEISQESKLPPSDEKHVEKPISLFRIGEKKTSIILNCPSNTLNLEVEGESRLNRVNRREKSTVEKEILKKQLSTKMLRKIKIEDTVKGWKGKDRLSDVKLGDFLINS